MESKGNTNYDKFTALFLSIALFIIMPFVYSFRLSDVEQSPRFLLLGMIVGISSLLSTLLIIKNKISVKKEKFHFIGGIFILINILSFYKSTNFGDGLFELLKLLLIFSLFFQFIILFSANEKNKFFFLKTITISAFIFIGFGCAQLFGEITESLAKSKSLNINYEISSTLGNKNFFAETLLLMLPLTILSIFYHIKFWKILSIIASLFIILIIIILQSMSTWVALIVGSVLMLILIFRFHSRIFTSRKAYKTFYLSISGAFIALIFFTFIFFQLAGTKQLDARLDTFKNLISSKSESSGIIEQNSSYERLTLWKHSLSMIGDYPFLGAGLGNWKILIPSYGMEPAAYMTTGVIRFVHPHNDYLLIASELGIFGVIVFLLFLSTLLLKSWSLIKHSQTNKEFYFGLSILFGLTIYVIISLFSMPLNRFYPPILLMFFAALIISSNRDHNKLVSSFGKKTLLIIVTLSFLVGVASTLIGNKRLKADLNLSSALLKEREGNHTAMRAHLKQIDRKYYPVDVTATPIAWYLGFAEFYLGDQQKAFELFKEAEVSNPNHLIVLNDLGTSYNLSGDAETAKAYYNKALKIQPVFGASIINLAIVYFNANQLDSAYNTLIKHKGHFKREYTPVFSTILSAKAATLTNNEDSLKSLHISLQKQQSIEQLLIKIRAQKNGFSSVLSDL